MQPGLKKAKNIILRQNFYVYLRFGHLFWPSWELVEEFYNRICESTIGNVNFVPVPGACKNEIRFINTLALSLVWSTSVPNIATHNALLLLYL